MESCQNFSHSVHSAHRIFFGTMASDHHFLADYLEGRLPELGLDYDTYGSYVMGLVPEDDEEVGGGADEEEWESILELLQASSESHGDDEQVWLDLKGEIRKRQEEHWASKNKEKEEAKQQKQQATHPAKYLPGVKLKI